jgi:GWxTD domain-containing protein
MKTRLFLAALAVAGVSAVLSAQLSAPMPDAEWKKWLGDVQPLMLPADVAAAASVTPADRGTFREEFWRARNPDPSSAENAVRTQYEERVRKAQHRYRSGGSWNDCGRTWLILGQPSRVQVTTPIMPSPTNDGIYGSPMGPSETWVYRRHPRLPNGPAEIYFPFNQRCMGEGEFDYSSRALRQAAASYVTGKGQP